MPWSVILRHGLAVMGNAPVLQHEDAVSEVENTVVVGDDDDRTVFRHRHFAQQVHHPAARARIERGGWLVTHHQPGCVDQRAGDGDALLLPAGQLARQFVRLIADEELDAVWKDAKPAKAGLDTAVSRGNAVLSAKPALKKAQPF